VLNAYFVVELVMLVVKCSVGLPLAVALPALFRMPSSTAQIVGLVQPMSAVASLEFVTGGNTNSATSSNGVGDDVPQVPGAQGHSSFNRVWAPAAAQSTARL
jgi:hypothetical protein